MVFFFERERKKRGWVGRWADLGGADEGNEYGQNILYKLKKRKEKLVTTFAGGREPIFLQV